MGRHEMERAQRAMARLMAEKDFENADEANKYLKTMFSGKKTDDIIAEVDQNPADRAQDLAYAAMDAETLDETLILCGRAVENDPGCVDALLLIAALTSDGDEERIRNIRKVVARAEDDFGQKYMDETRGHFWGYVETRPYMRVREALIHSLQSTGKIKEAIAECEESLALNPRDNQGIRDILRGLYFEVEDLEGVRRLHKEFPGSMLATANWGHVLERFLSGNFEEAEKALRHAHKSNKHVLAFLTGRKRLPEGLPGHYSPGDSDEAVCCCDLIGEAWRSHSKAMKWLKGVKGLK